MSEAGEKTKLLSEVVDNVKCSYSHKPEVQVGRYKRHFHQECSAALEEVAWGGCGVSDLGCFQDSTKVTSDLINHCWQQSGFQREVGPSDLHKPLLTDVSVTMYLPLAFKQSFSKASGELLRAGCLYSFM